MIAPDAATPVAPSADEDPFSAFGGLGPQLGLMLVLAAIAVMVVWISRRAGKAPRGRSKRRPDWADPEWRAKVAALQAAPTPIAEAKAGEVCVIATLSAAPLSLGGPPERACVWRNGMGADAATAIAAELVFVADASGRAALEQLEHARVIAPPETAPVRRGSDRTRRVAALYLGDRVEICARFDVDPAGNDPDPRNLVYGTLGAEGPVEIRVIERPESPEAQPQSPATPPTSADADVSVEGPPT